VGKTVRTCRQLLQLEPAMWLFITVEGVEPTNNAAERAIRPAVLWRRTSFGAQSQAGVFVARMLTVVTTLHSQNRNVLEYLSQACQAAREANPPSLLPDSSGCRAKTVCCLTPLNGYAASQFAELDLVKHGEEVTILEAGVAIARLVPAPKQRSPRIPGQD